MRYRLRRLDDGVEYTRECNEHFLKIRRALNVDPDIPLKVGDTFVFQSKLDKKDRHTEQLVAIKAPVIPMTLSTWKGGSFRTDTMGINPDDRIEQLTANAERGIRGVDYDENSGEAIFSSPGAYRKYCEANGFFDRNASYSSAQKLDERECAARGIPYQLGSDDVGQPNVPIFMDDDPRQE